MIDVITALISVAGTMFTGYVFGVVTTDRKNRRENAATAECVACDWTSGPVPLAAAFRAATAHTATPAHTDTDRHRAMVVKAR